MTMKEVREKARALGLKIKVGLTKADGIRLIQEAEGNTPCFGSGNWENCGQEECCFRSECKKLGLALA